MQTMRIELLTLFSKIEREKATVVLVIIDLITATQIIRWCGAVKHTFSSKSIAEKRTFFFYFSMFFSLSQQQSFLWLFEAFFDWCLVFYVDHVIDRYALMYYYGIILKPLCAHNALWHRKTPLPVGSTKRPLIKK